MTTGTLAPATSINSTPTALPATCSAGCAKWDTTCNSPRRLPNHVATIPAEAAAQVIFIGESRRTTEITEFSGDLQWRYQQPRYLGDLRGPPFPPCYTNPPN